MLSLTTSIVLIQTMSKSTRGNNVREKIRAMLQSLYEEHSSSSMTDEVINGKKVVVLPPSISKKQLFRKFAADQGWEVTIIDRKTNKMAKVKDWPLLPGYYATEQDAALNHGKVAGEKINHTSFSLLWKEEFPHLKVVEGMMKGE
jgi:cellobiose-specific phosphotransferase system component IIB